MATSSIAHAKALAAAQWHQLKPREKQLVSVPSIVVVMVIIWMAMMDPAYRYYQQGQQQLRDSRELLSWIKEVAPVVKGGTPISNTNTQGLLSIVNRVASANQIPIRRAEPKEDVLSVWFDQVEFNNLLSFLEKLELESGVRITQLSIEAGQSPGSAVGNAVLAM